MFILTTNKKPKLISILYETRDQITFNSKMHMEKKEVKQTIAPKKQKLHANTCTIIYNEDG